MANGPLLRQSVRWGEEYVSRALNLKFAGILPAGVYRGFKVLPGPGLSVEVGHGGEGAPSVAVVERDGYSLTIIMDDGGLVEIPAPGEWKICLEAFYAPTQQGYQRIVAREKTEAHHIVLASASATDSGVAIQKSSSRNAALATAGEIELANRAIIAALANVMRLSGRTYELEKSRLKHREEFKAMKSRLAELEDKELFLESLMAVAGQADALLGANIMRLSSRALDLELNSQIQKEQ